MIGKHGHMLGLALGQRAIHCAQVHGSGRSPRVEKLARFDLPADAWQQPEQVGLDLRAFLRQHHFTATRAVIGLPAKWLIAQTRQLPPAGEAEARAMLRLAAERQAVADNAAVRFDYAGEAGSTQATEVLLVGVLEQQLDRVTRMAQSAGLSIKAVTATALAAASLVDQGDRQTLLMLSDQGIEVISRRTGVFQGLRHVSIPVTAAGTMASAQVAKLGSELQRVVSLSTPVMGTGDAGNTRDRMVWWDGLGMDATAKSELVRLSGLIDPAEATLDTLDVSLQAGALNGAHDTMSPTAFVPAVALGVCGLGRIACPIDFAHSKLVPPPVRRLSQRTRLIGAVATILVLGLGGLYLTVLSREAQALALEAQLREMADDIKAAEAVIDRVSYGRGYYQTRPGLLACLRELTLSLGEDEPIWITSFNLRENGRGQLYGKATDQRAVLIVLDRLKANEHFSQVQLQDLRDAGARSRESIFSIAFVFMGTEQP